MKIPRLQYSSEQPAEVPQIKLGRNRKKILVVPHSCPEGGAGIYIKKLIEEITVHQEVVLEGRFSHLYGKSKPSFFKSRLPNYAVIPLYFGVKLKALLFHMALLPFRLSKVIVWILCYRAELKSYDTIIFTSSIDLLHVAAVKLFLQKVSVVCVIQENLPIEGARGKILKALLNIADTRIVITQAMAEVLRETSVTAVLAPNPFSTSKKSADLSRDRPIDLIYVGGDQRIKGFNFLIQIVSQLSKQISIKTQILGKLSSQSKKIIDDLNQAIKENGSSVMCAGFVDNTDHFFASAKLLLLPITHSHFCRPAMEAGLNRCTFIVTNLNSLGDFAQFDYNCLSAESGDLTDWLTQIKYLLENDDERQRLAKNNEQFARSKLLTNDFTKVFGHIAKGEDLPLYAGKRI